MKRQTAWGLSMVAKHVDELAEFLKTALQRSEMNIERMPHEQLRDHALDILTEQLAVYPLAQRESLQTALPKIVDNCVGFGPLAPMLADSSISEIMVNDYQTIFVERGGVIEATNHRFSSESDLHRVIDRIVMPLGRRLDSAHPMVDARLPDGSRVNAVLTPLAINGSCLTIRKFLATVMSLQDLVTSSSLSATAADYLTQAMVQRKNILISGGTGSGKTTLLNSLSAEIAAEQRIVTIEDAAELKLSHQNLIALEARPANAEGQGEITIRDLLINALRMRPDRIIIGECRGAEAIDMLQAMNTGHDGSLTTIHANSAREALQRLEVMVLMAGFDMPLLAVRQQIAAAIDIVIQIARSQDGSRQVVEICEVAGIDGHAMQLNAVFNREHQQLVTTGVPSEWLLTQPSFG